MSQSNATTNGALIVMGTGDATDATNQVGLPEAQSTEALLLQQQQFHNSVTASPAGILRPQQQTNEASYSASTQSTLSTDAVATTGSPLSISTDRVDTSQAVHGENNAMTIASLTNQNASIQHEQPQSHIEAQSNAGAAPTESCTMGTNQQSPNVPSPAHLQLCDRCFTNIVTPPLHGQGICSTCEEEMATQPCAHQQFAPNAEMQAIVTPVQETIQAAIDLHGLPAAAARRIPMYTPQDARLLIRSLQGNAPPLQGSTPTSHDSNVEENTAKTMEMEPNSSQSHVSVAVQDTPGAIDMDTVLSTTSAEPPTHPNLPVQDFVPVGDDELNSLSTSSSEDEENGPETNVSGIQNLPVRRAGRPPARESHRRESPGNS